MGQQKAAKTEDNKPLTLEWYVLRAISGKELQAKEYIENEVAKRNWTDIVPQVLVPTEEVVMARGRKRIVKEKVIVSGYVYVQAFLSSEVRGVIQTIPNVIEFISAKVGKKNGDPIPVPQAEMDVLLNRLDRQRDEVPAADVSYAVGDIIVVKEGPYETFEGEVAEVDNDKQKLVINISIFNDRKTPLELSFNQVAKKS